MDFKDNFLIHLNLIISYYFLKANIIHPSSRARLDFKMHSQVRTWRKSCLTKKCASRLPTHFQSRVSLAEFLRHPLKFPLKKKLPDVLSCLVSVISCHICFYPSFNWAPSISFHSRSSLLLPIFSQAPWFCLFGRLAQVIS